MRVRGMAKVAPGAGRAEVARDTKGDPDNPDGSAATKIAGTHPSQGKPGYATAAITCDPVQASMFKAEAWAIIRQYHQENLDRKIHDK